MIFSSSIPTKLYNTPGFSNTPAPICKIGFIPHPGCKNDNLQRVLDKRIWNRIECSSEGEVHLLTRTVRWRRQEQDVGWEYACVPALPCEDCNRFLCADSAHLQGSREYPKQPDCRTDTRTEPNSAPIGASSVEYTKLNQAHKKDIPARSRYLWICRYC